MDYAELCDFCYEKDCTMCSLGNPCLGCSDYDIVNDVCITKGGCTRNKDEERTDKR